MEKIIIIGLGTFGKNLALKLMQFDVEVVAVDSKIELINEIQDEVTYAVCLDSSDEKALNTLGLDNFDVGVVCIGDNFEANLLASVLLKNGGVKKVITRANDPIRIKILKEVGIDEVITPELEVSDRLANRLVFKNLFDFVDITEKLSIAKIKAPKYFINKTIGEINLRAKYGINVITIEHDKRTKDSKIVRDIDDDIPDAKTVIKKDDTLIIIGNIKNIRKIVGE